MKCYMIGSLRNREVVQALSADLRQVFPGVEFFDDWLSPGPEADDMWKTYETARGRTYCGALQGHAARHVFAFDKHHLDTSDIAVLVCPAGKSCHLEAGYMVGQGKPVAILLEEKDCRWDVMYQFADAVVSTDEELVTWLETKI